MTPAQLDAARAVCEELRFMFVDAQRLTDAEAALAGVCQHYGLPELNGDLTAKLSGALMAVSEAMDAYDEFRATAAGERLKVAA